MGTKLEKYHESGKFGLLSPIILLVFGLIGGLILGAIYSYGVAYIPFIYLNALLAAGLGLGVAFLTSSAGKIGKVRNRAVMAIFGLINGLIALYVQWVVWIHILLDDLWIWKPNEVWEIVQLILPEGTWSIGRSSDLAVSGTPLAIVWIIEALIIVGIPLFSAVLKSVYCEECEKWIDDEKELKFAITEDIELVKTELESGNLTRLKTLEKLSEDDESRNHIKIHYAICSECNHTAYMSLDKVIIETDKKGNAKPNTTELFEHLMISRAVFEELTRY